MLYLTTDTHIGHLMLERTGQRPVGFSELILENWRETVTDADTVLHLGDVAFHNDTQLTRIAELPGRKILVRGNHDSKAITYYMEHGFAFACDELMMKLEGIHILFSHHPQYDHTADINIHGHQHDLHMDDRSKLYLPLALESNGYRLFSVDHEFLRTLRRWVDRKHVPTEDEILEIHQRNMEGWL